MQLWPIHVEITDLIVPQVGDDLEHAKKLSKFIYDEFGPEMPIHFLSAESVAFGLCDVIVREFSHTVLQRVDLGINGDKIEGPD